MSKPLTIGTQNEPVRRAGMWKLLASGLVIAGLAGCCAWFFPPPDTSCPLGAGQIGDESTVSYAADIRPLLSRRGCLSSGCHGGFFPSSNYSLSTFASSFVPGEEAQAFELCPIVPGDPDASYLVEKIQEGPRSGARMPLLRAALPDSEIEMIATWIREGAQNN